MSPDANAPAAAAPHGEPGDRGEHAREPLVQRIVRAFLTGPLSPMLLIVAAVVGAVAVLMTPREEEPQIVVPMADVFVSYPGASAEEVERLVATPLEKLLWQVDGVEHVYSQARRDGALVTVRFFVGQDRERALVRLVTRIDAHRDEVPPGVAGWVVKPVEIDDLPIVTLTLWSERAEEGELRRLAEEMAARLDALPDLSRTEVLGGLPREVRVELDPESLAGHGLSPLQIEQALRGADASLPAGAFDREDHHVDVVAGPFLKSARDVERLVVGAHDDRPVYLSEVAKVVDGPAEPESFVRIGFGPAAARRGGEVAAATALPAGKSFPAVTIALAKQRGTNAVQVASEIVAAARRLEKELLPPDVHVELTRDWGETANEKVNELLGHLGLAIVTVVGLVAFALGWREGLIVAAAVPVTFAFTLIVNLLFGYSINRVTLFALVLVLGLVCDDPIVDVENIHRHLARMAKTQWSPMKAVLFAVNEVRPPVIVATLAVILSFVPMLFITEMMGPYMRPMAINVPVAMAMSLLVAFTITPWMAYLLLRGKTHAGGGGVHDTVGGMHEGGFVDRIYRRVVAVFVDRGGARALMWLALVGLLGASGLLVLKGAIPLKMLPYDNKSEFSLVLDQDEGTTLAATDATVRDVERYLATVPEVTDFVSHVGVPGPIDFNGLVRHYNLRRGPHLADLRVNLVPKHERSQQSHALALRIRNDLEAVAARHAAKLKIVEMPPGPPVLATLVAEVRGPPGAPHAELVAGAHEVERRLQEVSGVVDVDVMAEAPHDRLDFTLDKEKAALHGVATADVARTLRLALSGDDAATVHEPAEREPLRVRVGLDRADRSGGEELARLSVAGAAGALVPLSELGSFTRVAADAPIEHKDLERVAFVLADVAGTPPVDAVFAMQKSLEAKPLSHGLRAEWSGEGEWKITVDVFRDLGLAFAGALVGIYVLLVLETRSLGLPLVIMLAIPLGLIGIVPGFWLLNRIVGANVAGHPDPVWFTATGMIGMIALAGIVVRNSIILIDFVRHRLQQGDTLRQAVIESGAQRLRPIVLTAGAAMLGAWPITLDPIFSGLAWSLIFGLIASTAFTLIVVPVVCSRVLRPPAA